MWIHVKRLWLKAGLQPASALGLWLIIPILDIFMQTNVITIRSVTLDNLPDIIEIPLMLMIFIGSVLVTIAFFWYGKRISTEWRLEQTGWIFAGFGWFVLSIATFYFVHSAYIAWIPLFISATVATLRFWYVQHLAKQIRGGINGI